MTSSVPLPGPLGEVTCVAGQTFCRSGSSGQIRAGGDHGVYIGDTRMLSTLVLRIDGEEPQSLGGYPLGPGAARFSACALANDNHDPALLIERRRVVTDAFWERLGITNHSSAAVDVTVEIVAAADFAYVFDVKNGRDVPALPGTPTDRGLHFADPTGADHAVLRAEPPPDRVSPGVMCWSVSLAPQTAWEMQLLLGPPDEHGIVWPGDRTAAVSPAAVPSGGLSGLAVDCSDARFTELIGHSVADLESLLVRDGDDRYFAAGTPWFLTLFGRDSLWSALMSLPLGTDVAGETLRVLARSQGVRHDPVSEEAPGKILHEVRHGTQVDRGDLPPLYYGTIDATPLFVTVLERAWRWGLAPAAVEALLPHAERALAWMADDGDPDQDGFLEYAATGERRLANQGWKDSSDAIFFSDGTLADPPIALCEVQGYAYQAATSGAALLDAFGRPGGERWRQWARRLQSRFRDAFWIGSGHDAYPALALDGRKRPVDSPGSNMGHLLGTGILNESESAVIAARLNEPDLNCGWGLRTMSAKSPRFNPLSYHGGSVWPHDTAIAVDGLARAGCSGPATDLLRGLIDAGQHFGFRLPELFGGEQRTRGTQPLVYPSACRPQAWAAGAALLLLRAVAGIEPDIPNRTLRIRPLRPAPFAHLTITDMPLAGGHLSLVLDGHVARVTKAPPGLRVLGA